LEVQPIDALICRFRRSIGDPMLLSPSAGRRRSASIVAISSPTLIRVATLPQD
jgi:hypothetical protein